MPLGSKVVMVIDDETAMLSLVATKLKRHGVAAIKVSSAEQALHLIKSMKPNLFLVDVLMPTMSGYELCRRIRMNVHTRDIPVVMFSALDTPQSRQQALECGANAFIPKLRFSELIDEITALLSSNGNGLMC